MDEQGYADIIPSTEINTTSSEQNDQPAAFDLVLEGVGGVPFVNESKYLRNPSTQTKVDNGECIVLLTLDTYNEAPTEWDSQLNGHTALLVVSESMYNSTNERINRLKAIGAVATQGMISKINEIRQEQRRETERHMIGSQESRTRTSQSGSKKPVRRRTIKEVWRDIWNPLPPPRR